MAESTKFFFLVAGHDYSRKGLDFYSRCTNRLYERIDFYEQQKNRKGKDGAPALSWTPPVQLRFFLFDIGTGKIGIFDHKLESGKRNFVARSENPWKFLDSAASVDPPDPTVELRKQKTFRAIEPTDHTEVKKDDGTKTYVFSGKALRVKDSRAEWLMSIADVYNVVLKAPEGSVAELSFFSHGFREGPILINSFEKSPVGGIRHMDDLDGRASLDFLPTMGISPIADGTKLRKFASTFDRKEGALRVWGCSVGIRDDAADRLERFLAATDSRSDLLDEKKIKFRDDLGFSDEKTIKSVLGYLVKRSHLHESYVYLAALNTRELEPSLPVLAVGACPGMGSDFEVEGYKLMKIFRGRWKYVRIYKEFLKIQPDERWYGTFDQTALDRIKTVMTPSPPTP